MIYHFFVFLQEHAGKLSQCCLELSETIKEDAWCDFMDILVAISKSQVGILLENFQSNLLRIFNGVVQDNSRAQLTCRRLRVLSHLVVNHTESLFKVGRAYAELNGQGFEEVMDRLFDVWLEKIDCMALADKKLSSIVLISLLPLKMR